MREGTRLKVLIGIFGSLFLSLCIVSTLFGRDIVAPRTDEDINFVTKPSGVNTIGLKIDGVTGIPEAASFKIAGAEIKQGSSFTVGDIKQSILTEAQFQSLNSTDWVAMKGQAVAGSTICVTYSICTLPDARNLFLRTSDASSALALAKVDDTTAKNGLSNAPSAVSGVAGTNVASTSVTVAGTNVKSTVTGGTISRATASTAAGQGGGGTTTVGDGAHTHYPGIGVYVGAGSYVNGGLTLNANPVSNGGNAIWQASFGAASGHSHTIPDHTHADSYVTGGTWSIGGIREAAAQEWSQSGTSSAAAQVWSHTIGTGSAAAQTITGDGETAPDHMVVNTFIKIN